MTTIEANVSQRKKLIKKEKRERERSRALPLKNIAWEFTQFIWKKNI